MQLNHQRRYRCVKPVVANVALSCKPQADLQATEINSLLSRAYPFLNLEHSAPTDIQMP